MSQTVKRNRERLIVALDTPSLEDAGKLIGDLDGIVSFYKVGLELFSACGWAAVDLVKKTGAKVFLDLKLHDIPNTVAKSMAVLCDKGVDMVTIHAIGGSEMMKKARAVVDERADARKEGPKVMGVTVLTSHSEEDLEKEMGVRGGLKQQVLRLAQLAKDCGLDGVISSPHETAELRASLKNDFLIVTPGVRPEGSDRGDQKRVLTPMQAINAGSDYLVIGRPITAASNPADAANSIVKSIEL